MKKDEKNRSTGRTICTRSLAVASASTEHESPGLRRSNRGTPSTSTKLIAPPTSSTRKSERKAPPPATVTKKSARMEKKSTASPSRRSDKGKNVSSENSKGLDKPGKKNAVTSSGTEESKDEMVNNVQESTDSVKKYEPKMTGRSYRAMIRGLLRKDGDAPSNEEEPIVVGCSRRVPAGNDDAREGNGSPHANSESKTLPVGETSLEKGTGVPVKSIRDTENMVLDAPPVIEARDDSIIGSPSKNLETQKLPVSTSSLEANIDLPLKRKRDSAGMVLDACAVVANSDDRVLSSNGVVPSPSGCKDDNQSERCTTCGKRQKVNDDFENLSACSCTAQPVQESDHVAQDMKEPVPATSRDSGETRKNIQQDISYDPKLSSMYQEYWVPVQLSDVQLEQYCQTLVSKSLSLSSLSKSDIVGTLEETLTSVRKTCDHPYVMDASLKPLLTKNLELHEFLDVEATHSPGGLLLANILEDFVCQRFGQDSYEHWVSHGKKSAINNFNKESQCFVLLLEIRACSQSIKLLRADALIIFGSSLNPSQDVKLIEKIKIESHSERTKIFRLYSICTVEEKSLVLARQNRRLENLNRPLTHALLMWGASYLFNKLDHFHGSETRDSGVLFEQSIKDGVIHEFSSILSSDAGEENEGKLCLLLEPKHAQGTYSTDSTLFGEKHVKLSDEDSPNIFWTKLLGGKKPMWKYCSDNPQRIRKRVRYLEGPEETAQIGSGGNIKKRMKTSDDVTGDNDERKASGKDNMGALESPNVTRHDSSRKSASGTNDTLSGSDAFGLYSMGGHISGIPEDMLAGIDWRQIPRESQRSLHAVLKPEMAKLCQVLHLSEDSTSMVEKFLEYVIENHRVCREPATTLQALQVALSWIAVSFVKQNLNREESLVSAKSELAFSCSREESLFLERTQGSHCRSVAEDVEKTISDLKKKFRKRRQKLVQIHEAKKVELVNIYADKKEKLETCKKVEASYIRVTYSGISTQSLQDALKRLEYDSKIKLDKLNTELDECLKSLEQMHEDAKKKLAEDEACWIRRIKNWEQAELMNCAPIQSGNNKHFTGICPSNTSKNAPNVHTCNDASGEATSADTNCMVSKGNQLPEAENTLRTMSGGSTQQVHEMVASRNDKALDVATLSREQPTDNVATKSQPNEQASITTPEILIPAGCQEYQSCDRMTSATPDEDVPSRVPEISQSFANLTKSASSEISLNRKEAIKNNRICHAGSDANDILDQQKEEACSLDKEIPDKLALPMPSPASVVETMGSVESDPDDQDICPTPSSPAGEQSDPAANIQGQNKEVSIEPQPLGSPMPSSPAGQQTGLGENIQGQDKEAAIEPQAGGYSMPSSPAGKEPDPVANIQGQNKEAAIEPQAGGSPMPSSLAGQQPDLAANIQGQNIEAAIEPLLAGSETVETGGFAALAQGDQVACSFPSSPAGNQPSSGANIEGPNINTSVESHIVGAGAVEIADSAVSDQEILGAQDACDLPSPLVGTQADVAANSEGQIITTVAQVHTAGSDAVETGCSRVSEQCAQNASPLPFSSPGNHPDGAVNTEGLNNTTVAEPHTTGLDACEMDIAEPGPQVERLTVANNVAQLVHEGGVEPSAGVTAPVPSLVNNGTGQSALQPVPHIPFPVFSDPFQHELEKLRREAENVKKTYEEQKSILKAELDRKMAEVQAEYHRKFHEVDAELTARTKKIETSRNLFIMNKLLASAFSSKCNSRNASHLSAASRGRMQQLAQRASQLNALRNYSAPAPQQPQASSFPSSVSRLSGLALNTAHCPMPQPRQPLTSNTAPSLSASRAANPAVNGRLHLPVSHVTIHNSIFTLKEWRARTNGEKRNRIRTQSTSRCAICLDVIRKEDGKAIFTAECSHSFHFDCITSNVKHGNRICPLCRTQWKQVPFGDDATVPVPVPTFPAQRGFEDDEFLPHGESPVQRGDRDHHSGHQALEINLFPQVSAVAKPVTRGDFAVLVHLKAEGVSDDRPIRAPLDLITAVNSLVSECGTNIAEGLKIGARVIEDRRWKNPVSGMMLLSDGSYRSRIASDARTATIDVGDMYAEEERDLIVILDIPCCDNGSAASESMSLLKVRGIYKVPVTNEIVHVESGELSIQRPVELTGEEVVSIEVDRQLNRFLVSQAMSEARVLADGGELIAAVVLLSNRERELSETVRMGSRITYRRSGRAYAFSSISSHSAQRATARGDSTHGYSPVQAYQTSPMARMREIELVGSEPGHVSTPKKMANANNWQEAKSDLESNEGLNLPKTLDPSSASSTGASRPSVDATQTDSSSARPRPTSSSSGPFSKSRCAICLDEIRKEDGKAIFTAECSHSFHFDCITSNVKHGNRICPLCRTQWKQVPFGDDATVPVPVPTFPAQRGFEDDEFLPHGESPVQRGDRDHHSGHQALEIKLLPQVSAVAKSVTRGDFAVLVHLKAEGVSGDTPTRAPLDLITVLDVSGSMEGMKMELMKNAMGFVIQNLGESDRLSVISFSSTARRLFPLRLMTEAGKQAAMQAVNSLVAGGGTNIAEGLRIGARVIEDRRWKNPVSGMMLLSDGQDNFTLGSYRNRMSSDARTATIDVGDMYAEEERDFLVILDIPCCDNGSAEAESMSLLKVRCVYKDPVTNEIVHVESGELSIQRPNELTGQEVVSIEVDRQLNRFLVSQAISEARVLADGGDLSAAVGLLGNRERELSETVSARSSDRLCQSLSSELSAVQERMTSRRVYQNSGRAYAFSSMSSHSAQRATARGMVSGFGMHHICGAPAPQAYQTSSMARMVSRSQQLGIGSSKPSPSPARGDRT
ncbi:unnamed protein product [Thlaspi arvense]|uniref:RING-type domain-containing protein n=1 Tax=Thlaspi arvense TaxID=13288 RepID=A0AAU9REN3_THLAR|nr:unnamed protein product [Thlaspi arvense]